MIGKDHEITSACIATSTICLIQYPTQQLIPSLLFIGTTTLGALVPDIDSASSKISKAIKIPLYKGLSHRGWVHSIFGWFCFTFIFYMFLHTFFQMSVTNVFMNQNDWLINIFLGFSFGYFLHLLEDSWSQAGILWFWPFSAKDEQQFKKKNVILKPVNHWGKANGRYIPIRHFWGRGYEVGSGEETAIVGFFVILAVLSLCKYFMT